MKQQNKYHIRDEETGDAGRIGEVTELAFRDAPHTCHRERLIVDGLRMAGDLFI